MKIKFNVDVEIIRETRGDFYIAADKRTLFYNRNELSFN